MYKAGGFLIELKIRDEMHNLHTVALSTSARDRRVVEGPKARVTEPLKDLPPGSVESCFASIIKCRCMRLVLCILDGRTLTQLHDAS